ncbi:MAG TPA: NUDIX hydrolase [Dehalococcoidia bacterium]|nr:NUDIX hydrolase [Dehalococcoidia bacterium]
MKVTGRGIAFQGKYLRIVEKSFETDAGLKGVWETVERTNIHNSGAVVVIALTRERELILERNWRMPLESYVIQFPAGLCDQKSESEEATARRELLEETGYMAGEMIPIVTMPMSPALTSTKGSHFLSYDVEYVGRPARDLTEEIEVIKVPVEEIGRFLLNLPKETALDLRVPGILWILEKKKLL